jgi:predicted nucleotidyltransferase
MSTLARASEKLEPQLSAVVLFGSLARGMRDFRHIDLLCVVAKVSDKSLLQDSTGARTSTCRANSRFPSAQWLLLMRS